VSWLYRTELERPSAAAFFPNSHDAIVTDDATRSAFLTMDVVHAATLVPLFFAPAESFSSVSVAEDSGRVFLADGRSGVITTVDVKTGISLPVSCQCRPTDDPANGQVAKFLSDLFPNLPQPFVGVLRISTSSSGLAVVGLLTRFNERGDFLITTTPPASESAALSNGQLFFPHLAIGGGYTTQLILFSGSPGSSSSGTLNFVSQSGVSLPLTPQ